MELIFVHQLSANQREQFRAILQNPRVYMWLRNGARYTEREVGELITFSREDARKAWHKRDYFYWAIIVDLRVVGMIGLHPALPEAKRALGRDCLQVTYALNPTEQGRGYATQALRMLCTLLGQVARSIVSIVRVDNFGSMRVMRRVSDLFTERERTLKKNGVEYKLFEFVMSF